MRICLIFISVNHLYTKRTLNDVGKIQKEDYLYAMNYNNNPFTKRYGADELSVALIIIGILLILAYPISYLIYVQALLIVAGLALIVWALYRAFSTNIAKRRVENDGFLDFFTSKSKEERKREKEEAKEKKRQRKENEKIYAYFFCPRCRKELRVPRNKGKIRIKCPNCGEEFIRKT